MRKKTVIKSSKPDRGRGGAAVDRGSLPVMAAAQARRLLLGAQGLLDDPDRKATAADLAKLIRRMGFVQIDTINVVERAHHLTLFSRLRGYRHEMLPHLLERKRLLFEHWTHDASAIPLEWFGHWKHRFERHHERIRRHAWWKERLGKDPQGLLEEVKKRIERDGPLLSKDFEREDDGSGKKESGAWWGWKPQKAALEHLWRTGELSVARRVNFQKVYDLTHRVFPEHHATPKSEWEEHVDWACRAALERLGVATPSELAAFWNAIDLAEARRWCDARAAKGEIERVMTEGVGDGGDGGAESRPRVAFAVSGWRKIVEKLPDPPRGMRLLSPFDPVIRDRKRLLRLFGFDYSFEAFVPGPKRKYGYYVLPVMDGERMAARLDPKFHRDKGVLEVKKVWWEKGEKPTKARRAELEEAVGRLADFIGAERVEMKADRGENA